MEIEFSLNNRIVSPISNLLDSYPCCPFCGAHWAQMVAIEDGAETVSYKCQLILIYASEHVLYRLIGLDTWKVNILNPCTMENSTSGE